MQTLLMSLNKVRQGHTLWAAQEPPRLYPAKTMGAESDPRYEWNSLINCNRVGRNPPLPAQLLSPAAHALPLSPVLLVPFGSRCGPWPGVPFAQGLAPTLSQIRSKRKTAIACLWVISWVINCPMGMGHLQRLEWKAKVGEKINQRKAQFEIRWHRAIQALISV